MAFTNVLLEKTEYAAKLGEMRLVWNAEWKFPLIFIYLKKIFHNEFMAWMLQNRIDAKRNKENLSKLLNGRNVWVEYL